MLPRDLGYNLSMLQVITTYYSRIVGYDIYAVHVSSYWNAYNSYLASMHFSIEICLSYGSQSLAVHDILYSHMLVELLVMNYFYNADKSDML